MKKIIVRFIMGFILFICSASAVSAQDYKEGNSIREDIFKGIILLFNSDMANGFASLRGKQLSISKDGSIWYEVKSDLLKMHADEHKILVKPGSLVGYYYASYENYPAVLNSSLQAYFQIALPGSMEGPQNAFTIKGFTSNVKGSEQIYTLYFKGTEIGNYLMDKKKEKALLIIGPQG